MAGLWSTTVPTVSPAPSLVWTCDDCRREAKLGLLISLLEDDALPSGWSEWAGRVRCGCTGQQLFSAMPPRPWRRSIHWHDRDGAAHFAHQARAGAVVQGHVTFVMVEGCWFVGGEGSVSHQVLLSRLALDGVQR